MVSVHRRLCNNRTHTQIKQQQRVKDCSVIYSINDFSPSLCYVKDILRMPRIIGITGNIACGKTAVGHMLLELGAERYIDTDAVVHNLYRSGQSIAVKVAEAFGPDVVASNGDIDRKKLGA